MSDRSLDRTIVPGALGDEVAEIPEVVNSARLQASLGKGVHFLGTALAEQASQAVEAMSKVSREMARHATRIVTKMVEVGQAVAAGKISPNTGEIAINNYLHALQLYQHAITNAAQVEAYHRAMNMLTTAKSVLFSILRMGIQAALPSLGNVLEEMDELAVSLVKPGAGPS